MCMFIYRATVGIFLRTQECNPDLVDPILRDNEYCLEIHSEA